MRESNFVEALLDPAAPAPAMIDAAYRSRFAIYRNNVALSLSDALATRFPAVQKVVGAEFFAQAARLFAVRHPPTSRMIAFYGDEFAGFLENLPGCEDISYLADLARLEAARTHAHHAADAIPLDRGALAQIMPAALGDMRVVLHPAVAVIDSAHPIVTIWAMNSGYRPLTEIDDWSAEAALISRPAFDVEVYALPPGGAAFLAALAAGAAFAAAAEAALAVTADFDVTFSLALLFDAGLVTQILPLI